MCAYRKSAELNHSEESNNNSDLQLSEIYRDHIISFFCGTKCFPLLFYENNPLSYFTIINNEGLF